MVLNDNEMIIEREIKTQHQQAEDNECCRKYCCCFCMNATSIPVGCIDCAKMTTEVNVLNIVGCVGAVCYGIFNLWILPRGLIEQRGSIHKLNIP